LAGLKSLKFRESLSGQGLPPVHRCNDGSLADSLSGHRSTHPDKDSIGNIIMAPTLILELNFSAASLRLAVP
jgi:hypothetical protein